MAERRKTTGIFVRRNLDQILKDAVSLQLNANEGRCLLGGDGVTSRRVSAMQSGAFSHGGGRYCIMAPRDGRVRQSRGRTGPRRERGGADARRIQGVS